MRQLTREENALVFLDSFESLEYKHKKALLDLGVTNAIYTDMGSGWNHAWYRTSSGIIELQPYKHPYCTNWITFYK